MWSQDAYVVLSLQDRDPDKILVVPHNHARRVSCSSSLYPSHIGAMLREVKGRCEIISSFHRSTCQLSVLLQFVRLEVGKRCTEMLNVKRTGDNTGETRRVQELV